MRGCGVVWGQSKIRQQKIISLRSFEYQTKKIIIQNFEESSLKANVVKNDFLLFLAQLMKNLTRKEKLKTK